MKAYGKKYINHIKCTICKKEMDTGMCYTKLGMWIKTKVITRRHWHTKAEVYGKKCLESICQQLTENEMYSYIKEYYIKEKLV